MLGPQGPQMNKPLLSLVALDLGAQVQVSAVAHEFEQCGNLGKPELDQQFHGHQIFSLLKANDALSAEKQGRSRSPKGICGAPARHPAYVPSPSVLVGGGLCRRGECGLCLLSFNGTTPPHLQGNVGPQRIGLLGSV